MAAQDEFAQLEDLSKLPVSAGADELVGLRAASRIAARDATVFGLPALDEEHAARFMGWTTLCSDPPTDPAEIAGFAAEMRAKGLTDVILVGQGGSSQAPMTMALLLAARGMLDVRFHTMDSLSPRAFRQIMDTADLASTLVVVSSKSGSTIEPNSLFGCVWERLCAELGEHAAGSRVVAITDPGSSLGELAHKLGFARVFHGVPQVGGRFSALSVFGLVPYALMGVDVVALLADCAGVQAACSVDGPGNPAIALASFLEGARRAGRDKVMFGFDGSCRTLGLWLEQLVAESLGKLGKGILPNTESDPSLLALPHADRCAIVYSMAGGQHDSMSIDPSVPVIRLGISSPVAVARHFLLWEHATALLGVLMGLNPFDQPNVESTKKAVRELLAEAGSNATAPSVGESSAVLVSHALAGGRSGQLEPAQAVEALVSSLRPGDYLSVNAFIPDCDEEAVGILEAFRRKVAGETGCAACLEMGPRYLHSIGQFQKGGPNTGAFLIISTDEPDDIAVPGAGYALGQLASTQATGDFEALDDAGRRAVRIHLPLAAGDALRGVLGVYH